MQFDYHFLVISVVPFRFVISPGEPAEAGLGTVVNYSSFLDAQRGTALWQLVAVTQGSVLAASGVTKHSRIMAPMDKDYYLIDQRIILMVISG